MPIHHQEPPAESVGALRAAAETLHPAHGLLLATLRKVSARPAEHHPHPVYTVGLADMAGAEGLSKATVTGWRYLAQSEEQHHYSFVVRHGPAGDDHRFTEMNRGPFVAGTLQVLADAKLHAELDAGVYRLSVLTVSALNIFALWLHAPEPGREVIAVVPPAPRYLEPWPKLYTLEEFQDAVRPQAARKLAASAASFI